MRTCVTCGKKVEAGMTDDYGDFYAHEGKCFIKYMDKTYGKHKWMEKGDGEPGENGGYYLFSSEAIGGCQDSGVYYTEWYDEEDEDDNEE